MIIYIKTDKTKIGTPLTVLSGDTITEVKKKVNSELGIPTTGNFFLFGDKILQDKSTLGDYNIKGDSVLRLITRVSGGGMQIFVKSISGENTAIQVSDDCTLSGLKKAIQEKQEIPVQDIRLLYGGTQLKGENVKLKAFNIINESAIYMVFRLYGGCGDISFKI